MSKVFRYLRIAFSATCVIAAVLLIALWVRSYRWLDMITCQCGSEQTYCLVSNKGKVGVVPLPLYTNQQVDPVGTKVFQHGLISMHLSPGASGVMEPDGRVTVYVVTNVARAGEHWGISLKPIVLAPYWMITIPAVLICAIGTAPFLKWQFSLRTLLIATTLVAVVLGVIVWAVR